MEENNFDYIQPGKVKNFYQDATPKEQDVLVRKYLHMKYLEEEHEKDPNYAQEVSEKLAKKEYYEKHIRSRRLNNSEKIFSATPSDLDSRQKEYERSTDLRNFDYIRRTKISEKLGSWFEETFPDFAKLPDIQESTANESVRNLANRLEDNNYYSRFDDPQILSYLSQVFKEDVRAIPSLESFSVPEVDNKYLGGKMKEIKKGKRNIDKKVVLDSKRSFLYKPVKLISDKAFGNLEARLNEQKTKINGFETEIESASKTIREYKNFLMDGFDNLCNYWMKADSLINDYSGKIETLKDERKNTPLFSWRIFENLKKRKNLKLDIKNYREGIKTLSLKKKDFENSFSTYKVLFDKNKKDTLFVENLRNEKNYYKDILNSSGNSILNLSNDQKIYSLEALESLSEFYKKD